MNEYRISFDTLSTNALSRACDIQAIPAPTFHEDQRAAYFVKQFREMGLEDVQQDGAGNVLGRLPGGSGRPLVISAHIDTVHPMTTPLGIRRSAERITGPGIGDNAMGAAALLAVVDMFKASPRRLPGDIWLAANTGEEGLGDLRGIQAIVERFEEKPIAYLVIEGMGLGTILHRGLGVERYKISVRTPGGHSWVDYGTPSAIHEISGIISRLASITLPRNPCTTLNVGVIQGGTSVNTIAAQAWLELDLRSEESTTLGSLVREVHEIVDAAQRENVLVRIERIGKRLAGQIPASHPLVVLAEDVLLGLGIEPHLDIASTDANMPLSRGYPSICIGITHGNNAHTMEEYIQTPPVAKGLEQLYRLVTQAWDRLGG